MIPNVSDPPSRLASARLPGSVAAIIVLFTSALFSSACSEKKVESAAAPPPEVEVVQVTAKDVPVTKEWVAVLKGSVDAEIRSQVSGYLLKQNYTNGTVVRKGDVLFEIDPRPFQAAVDQAKANLDQAKAAVGQAEANLQEARAKLQRADAALGKTENDVTRYTPLAKDRAIPQQDLDNAVQANLASKADVEAAKAAITTAQSAIQAKQAAVTASEAELQSAQLNLGFTKVTALIDGIAGIANAQVGNFVGPQSPMPLTIVSTIDPILAQFAPSEQEYLKAMASNGGSSDRTEDALRMLSFDLVLADGSLYPEKGRLQFIDREVDPKTGSINIQVAFPNPERVLRPGGYGNIKAVVRTQRGALAIPQRAITELQGRTMVAVVDNNGMVAIKGVKTGERVGPLWVIEDGLKPGDRVVAEGIQKVRDGMLVTPKPFHEDVQKEVVKKG